jgi:hypothetical protein
VRQLIWACLGSITYGKVNMAGYMAAEFGSRFFKKPKIQTRNKIGAAEGEKTRKFFTNLLTYLLHRAESFLRS